MQYQVFEQAAGFDKVERNDQAYSTMVRTAIEDDLKGAEAGNLQWGSDFDEDSARDEADMMARLVRWNPSRRRIIVACCPPC